MTRADLRDLLELVLIPAVAAVLPWGLCFRLFRRISQSTDLYRAQVQSALAGARAQGLVTDERSWAAAHRLLLLVDHADLYLSRFRSDRWMDRYLHVRGDAWPRAEGPVFVLGFHWGAGLWFFRHMRRQGTPVAPLFRYAGKETLPGQAVRARYYQWRIAEVERGAGTQALYTGRKHLRELLNTLDAGGRVIALVDVPPDSGAPCLPITLLGRQARLPRGLIRLLVERRLTVMCFTLAVDPDTGSRIMTFFGPLPTSSERDLTEQLGQILSDALSRDPAAWHFWAFAPAFFDNP